MRVSVSGQQDLITQIYFKDGKYVDTDTCSSDPKAAQRIPTMTENKAGGSEIVFNVVMQKEIPLDAKVYDKITGLYRMCNYATIEFTKNGDLLFMKYNGQLSEALKYTGGNTFEGGIGFPKISFELLTTGGVKVTMVDRNRTYNGEKHLKYD